MTGITLTERAARRINEIMAAEPAGSNCKAAEPAIKARAQIPAR